MALKNAKAAAKWKDLTDEEKHKYKAAAEELKSPKDVSSLDDNTKQKLVSAHVQILAKEVFYSIFI